MRRIKRLENLEQESEKIRRKDDTLTNFFYRKQHRISWSTDRQKSYCVESIVVEPDYILKVV